MPPCPPNVSGNLHCRAECRVWRLSFELTWHPLFPSDDSTLAIAVKTGFTPFAPGRARALLETRCAAMGLSVSTRSDQQHMTITIFRRSCAPAMQPPLPPPRCPAAHKSHRRRHQRESQDATESSVSAGRPPAACADTSVPYDKHPKPTQRQELERYRGTMCPATLITTCI